MTARIECTGCGSSTLRAGWASRGWKVTRDIFGVFLHYCPKCAAIWIDCDPVAIARAMERDEP